MSEKQYSMLRAGKLEKNDILYCIRGSLGKCGIFQMEQGAIASSLVIVRPYFKTLSTIKYLLSYLTSDFIRTEIYKYDSGTAQPNLAANDFSQFLIPLPPQSEQKRISETVETLLQLVETIDSDKIDLSNLIKQTKASGIDMTRDIAERLNQTFDTPVEIKRIALNMSQIDEYNPPPNPAKLTDSRVGGYLKKYGRQSWELDALDPKTITTLIEKESNKYTDIAKRNRLISKLNEQKNLLIKCSENWEDITEYLTNQE